MIVQSLTVLSFAGWFNLLVRTIAPYLNKSDQKFTKKRVLTRNDQKNHKNERFYTKDSACANRLHTQAVFGINGGHRDCPQRDCKGRGENRDCPNCHLTSHHFNNHPPYQSLSIIRPTCAFDTKNPLF